MIYSIFDAIYDTYSTAIFHPPGGQDAARQLRRLDRDDTAQQIGSWTGHRIRPGYPKGRFASQIDRSK